MSEPDEGGRLPPHDPAAERSVLGAMMLSKDAITDAVDVLRGGDFYHPAHEIIFDAISDMYGAGEAVDAVTLSAAMSKAGTLTRAGGAPYLFGLTVDVPLAANAPYYARIIAEKAILRRTITAAERILQRAYKGDDEVEAIVDAAQAEILAVSTNRAGTDYVPLYDALEPTLDHLEAVGYEGEALGVPTGFMDLDDLLNGFQGGQMVVVAGRPAMGKSTLGIDFARSASIHNNMASCVFSLEMSQREITTRILSAESKVSLSKMNSGHLGDEDWGRIAGSMQTVGAAPLFIDDSANLTMTEIRAKARRLVQSHGLRLIVIDYLQLMSSGKRVESRQTEVSEFSRQIKLMSKELNVPVVAICQLNRGPEQRSNKRPMMSDLRESGSLEQDADIVLLLHREDYYEHDGGTRPGEADIIVAKHRNGPTRDVTVVFQGHYSRFVDMAR